MTVYSSNRYDALVRIPVNGLSLRAVLSVPVTADGLVIIAYSEEQKRRQASDSLVISALQRHSIATLVVDLMSLAEMSDYTNHFDLELISERLSIVTDWAVHSALLENLPVGFYVTGTAAAAALAIAGGNEAVIKAIVSVNGRLDHVESFIDKLKILTLLVVSAADKSLHAANEAVFLRMICHKELAEYPQDRYGSIERDWSVRTAELSVRWYGKYLQGVRLRLTEKIDA